VKKQQQHNGQALSSKQDSIFPSVCLLGAV